MAVDRIDAQIAGLVSDAQRKAQEQLGKDEETDAQRKAAEKKIAQKQAALKQGVVQRESFQRQQQVDARLQQILGGAAGPEAAHALGDWQQNRELQTKLTEAQKQLFRESMAQSPARGAEAAQALNRLSREPGFQQAIQSSQHLG